MISSDEKKEIPPALRKGHEKRQRYYKRLRKKRIKLILKLLEEASPYMITESDLYRVIKKEYDDIISKTTFKSILEEIKTEKKLTSNLLIDAYTGKWRKYLILLTEV